MTLRVDVKIRSLLFSSLLCELISIICVGCGRVLTLILRVLIILSIFSMTCGRYYSCCCLFLDNTVGRDMRFSGIAKQFYFNLLLEVCPKNLVTA